jgi:hypothetical protein
MAGHGVLSAVPLITEIGEKSLHNSEYATNRHYTVESPCLPQG